MHHFSKNGGIVTSRVGAIGIGQHMPSNIANLNNWIDLKQLKGNKFSLEKVRNIPSENIRATAATIRNLIDVSDACSNKSEETIGCVIETAARYNAGSGAVERAQKLAGSNNVWRVLNHLPLETEGHARRSAIYFWVYKKGLFWPTRGTEISSNYGSRWSGKHKGMDINPGHPGDPIYAIQDGVVANRHRDSINGYFVTVIHGPAMLGFYSGYAHGMAGSTRVNIGDKVDSGEILMSEGNTGRVRGQRGGYHLHLATYFRYRHKNRIITEYFDPMSLYKFFTGSMGRDITHVPQL
jgi:murein DD-endopeptidase MepM/ murein hydrolase activator NlpD